jgi:hypothetical protein
VVVLSLAILFLLQSTALALSPIQAWRQQYFGTTNNLGNAADGSDPDGDGLINILEYAVGLNPLSASTNPVTTDISTGNLRVTIPRNTNAFDVTLTVEITANLLAPLSWTTNGIIIDQNTAALLRVRDSAPIVGATAKFMRLKIADLDLAEPGVPLNLLLTPGAAGMTVAWNAPATNGGLAINFYSVLVFDGGQLVTSNTTSATSKTINGLTTANYPSGTVGKVYSFRVSAHNAVGYGSAASSSATPKVSYFADNLRGIWTATSCTACHGPSLLPNLTPSGTTDYTSAVNEGTLIYRVPANQAPPHHNGMGAYFSSNSLEYKTLSQWVNDGNLQ